MKQRFISLIYFIAIFFILLNIATGYDDKTTHPALTDEIVDFYNLSFPNQQLTSQQKEWIVEGSILEDTPPRWINHFYDPINKIGWSGEYAGKYDAETVKLISQNLIAPYNIVPVSSLEWLHNEQLQAKYGFYGGAKTWERGILEMIKGNEKESYKILGYILHLIEDASVPDHSRNDTHVHELEKYTNDYGSPYEEYLKQYNRQNLNIASDFYQQGLRPIIRNTIDEYLISLAEYSNKYFFSKDTINDPKYQNPKIIRDDENYGYGLDENGKEFPLVKIERPEVNGKTTKIYSLKDKDEKYILSAYFSRLSRQAVLNGAGIIDLFHNEVEFKKEYSPHLIVFDFSIYNYFAIPRVSIVAEWIRAKNAALTLAGQIDSAVNNITSSVGGFFSGIFGDSENSQQVVVENSASQVAAETALSLNNQNSSTPNQNNSQSNTFGQDFISGNAPSFNTVNSVENLSVNQLAKQQALLSALQLQLNEISNKANNLNQQIQLLALQSANVNNIPLVYYGGGGGAPVILSVLGSDTPAENQQSDNQQQITQDFQQNSTSTDQTASSTEATLTATSTITILSLNHLVISEIQISGSKADDEFIEIYNPTSEIISLDNYSIQYLSGLATSTEKIGNTKKNFKNNTQISPYGFYLLAQNDGIFASQADMTYSFSLSGYENGASVFLIKSNSPISGLDDPDIVDYISYGEVGLAGVSTSTMSLVVQSLERKSWQDNQCAVASNSNEFAGNGCDTDNNNFNFEIRETPNPQNSSSLPEPRSAPTAPQNFNVQYSSSTKELIFNWLESQDYSGSTSTLTYKIQEMNNSSSSLPFIKTTSTNAAIVISEFGRNYEFNILAFDMDGLESTTSLANIYIDAPQDVSATSTDSLATSTQILLSQLGEASSSIGYAQVYQEFGNGISGKLQSLELKMYTGDACQYFFFQEFDDFGYSQLLREFSSRKQNPDSVPDFVVRLPDGSLWNYSTCKSGGGGKITIEFNNDIEVISDKYYRLYFESGDASRRASFAGSDFDAGFGSFKGYNLELVDAYNIIRRWISYPTPDFDIYFVLRGIAINVNLPIQQ